MTRSKLRKWRRTLVATPRPRELPSVAARPRVAAHMRRYALRMRRTWEQNLRARHRIEHELSAQARRQRNRMKHKTVR